MLNFYVIKVNLKKKTHYRAIITRSGKGIKSKTFTLKTNAKAWGKNTVSDFETFEATGKRPCTITFNRLTNEYIQAWAGKDHDRVRLVTWWTKCFNKMLLSEITLELIYSHLNSKRSNAPSHIQ
jgi:hypothetical protein